MHLSIAAPTALEPSDPLPGFRLGYRPALDGLRGLAVLIVMVGHATLIGTGADLGHTHLNYPLLLKGAYLGVDVFLALSGFLITALLVEEHRTLDGIRLPSFYARRARRLLPALVLMLVACCVYAAFQLEPGKGRFILRGVALSACGASNFYWCVPGLSLGMLIHHWSLCLEEQFYLVWPFVLRAMLRSGLGLPLLIVLVALGAAVSALFRFAMWRWGGVTGYHVACVSLPARADGLLAGALVALVVCRGGLSQGVGGFGLRIAAWVAMGTLAAMVLWCWPGAHRFYGGYSLAGLSAAVLIGGLVAGQPQSLHALLATPPLVWVGRVSYGLYLWHVPVFCVVPLVLHRIFGTAVSSALVGWVIAFGLSVVLAALSFYFIERPLRRWRPPILGGSTQPSPLAGAGEPVTSHCPWLRTPA